jgi:hypothetical protein
VGGPWVSSLDGSQPDDASLRNTAVRTAAAQVRFCPSGYRRVKIQRDQGRGGLGHRSTV